MVPMVKKFALPDVNFWRGKKILLTGHTGFKGAWLVIWLEHLGAQVYGYALDPESRPNLFDAAKLDTRCSDQRGDVRNFSAFNCFLSEVNPEIVIHFAAQALVRRSYAEPMLTFETNVMGTTHVLEACKDLESVQTVLVITTDKVYRNDDIQRKFKETDPLGGHDPYSASKAAAEMVCTSYLNSYYSKANKNLIVARAGNVIGGGDWSEDRLIPDLIRSWLSGASVDIRNPSSTRPWQHVLEPLLAYLLLIEAASMGLDVCRPWNIGPEHAYPVSTIVDLARHEFGRGEVNLAQADPERRESKNLDLDNSDIRAVLDLPISLSIEDTVSLTLQWYRQFYEGQSAFDLCVRDIERYCVLKTQLSSY